MNRKPSKLLLQMYAIDISVTILKHLVERTDTRVKINSIILAKLEAMINELQARGEL